MSRTALASLALVVPVLATLHAGVMHGARSALAVAVVVSTVAGAVGLSFPFLSRNGGNVLAVVLFLLLALPFLLTRERAQRLARRLEHGAAQAAVVASLSVVIPFGALELAAQVLTDTGLVSYYVPFRTVAADTGGLSEDWRRFHITVDSYREPDPVLFWRPLPVAPYTAQRFKGPLVEVPKPPRVLRIMAYGDSNTDGPDQGGWPAELQRLLENGIRRRVQVLNAGVSGYSSLQGLRRFRQEARRYQPDVVLVSFGWNDLPEALGKPDKDFQVSPLAPVQRGLLRYRFYLMLRHQLTAAPQASAGTEPRVSLADYATNLAAFGEEGKRHGATVVLLTRPHRATPREIQDNPTWRRDVPKYNEALRRVARNAGIPAVDVQRAFEGRQDLFSDECHFTTEGHRLMAELLHRELQPLLPRDAS